MFPLFRGMTGPLFQKRCERIFLRWICAERHPQRGTVTGRDRSAHRRWSGDGVKFGKISGRRQALAMIGAAGAAFATAVGALAADVNITSNVTTGINLDTQTGSTVEVFPGVSVTNAGSSAIAATVNAWALANRGTVSATLADTVSLSVAGSSVTNFSSITGIPTQSRWRTAAASTIAPAPRSPPASAPLQSARSEAPGPARSQMPAQSPKSPPSATLSSCFPAARSPTCRAASSPDRTAATPCP